MASLPVEVLLGIYLGLLTGIIPAMVSWLMGFLFRYVTGVTVPGFGVVVLGLAIAGLNGGLLALNDPTIRQGPDAVALLVAVTVVLMLTLYAHAQGDKMGAAMPRRLSLRSLRERTLSTDVVELVGGRGQVRVAVAGEVEDMEGYPPLPAELRGAIREGEWTLPADLPLPELESRLEATLREEFDLVDVNVRLDERGHATVAAAPPTGGLSKRVPAGKRAVSVGALVPTGLARGDEVTVHVDGRAIRGTVVSAQSDVPGAGPVVESDGGEPEPPAPAPAMPVTDGGDGRITVAVDREDAARLLAVDRAHVTVRSRGKRREFELLSLLRQAGKRFARVTVAGEGDLAGRTIGEAAVRDAYGVVVLAIRTAEGWTLAPGGDTEVGDGDELVAVGTRENLDRFGAVVS